MNHMTVIDVRCNKGDSAFLLDDGKTSILYDSGFGYTGFTIAEKVRKHLGGRNLDYIFLTHSHYDHALGSAYIRRVFPQVKVVAHEYAAYVFTRSGAIETMRKLDRSVACQNGVTNYEFLGNELKVDIPVKDGDVIQAGNLSFTVLGLPGHTKCSIGYYCNKLKMLLSAETLGVYDGESTITASFLVGYRSSIDSIQRVLDLEIDHVVAPHYGLLSKEQTDFYLGNILDSNISVARFLMSHIHAGEDTETIIEAFRDRYWKGYIREIYPIDALKLNSSIMIELLKKENPSF